ncbi:MAG: hypothetical protein QF512_20665, partial [Alphaproteobacteria bacterium]|nr:hypothetical protein [Alphaproteobacteria bacterium]
FWYLNNYVGAQFTIGVLGFAAAIITASIQYRSAKDKETDSRLFSEKQSIYTELMETMMGFIHQAKDPEWKFDEEEFVPRLQAIKTKLIVWGSFDTIRTLDKMGEIEVKTDDPSHMLVWLGELMANIRKDLGHKDPNDAGIEIALGLIIPTDRAALRNTIMKVK